MLVVRLRIFIKILDAIKVYLNNYHAKENEEFCSKSGRMNVYHMQINFECTI